jgi:general secretion pathway protein D
MKSLALGLAAIVLTSGAALAAPPAESQATARTISLQDADIRTFIEEVSRATDVTMIVDPRVQGSVSVSIEGLSREDVLRVFVTTLRTQGVAATPSVGGAYRVYPMGDGGRHQSAARAASAGEARYS